MSRILVAEDEERIAAFVQKGLRSAGFEVDAVPDGETALDAAASGRYDLMVLDLGLTGLDGLTVLRRLRSGGGTVPVIVLTARDDGADTVAGFESGANDYVTKPFRFDELLVRVRARMQDAMTGPIEVTLSAGGLTLDLRTRRASVDGGPEVDLSSREFELAEEFLRHPEQVLSREHLLSAVWGMDFDPGSNVVDVYVRYLRQKIGADRLETVRGEGYRLAAT